MNDRELNAAYFALLYYDVPQVKISQYMYLSNIPVKSVVRVFEPFDWQPRALFSSAFCFGLTAANKLKNGSCILPGNVSPGKDIYCEKTNQTLWLAHFFKTQKPSGCGTTTRKCQLLMDTLSLPMDTHMRRHKNDHWIILFYLHTLAYWFHPGHDSVIQSTSVW